jgi:hypothetical protein
MSSAGNQLNVAIACGGTGGHLFPGIAVAGQLSNRGVSVALMVSPKEIDQLAVKTAKDTDIVTLPAVGLTRGRLFSFLVCPAPAPRCAGNGRIHERSAPISREALPGAGVCARIQHDTGPSQPLAVPDC